MVIKSSFSLLAAASTAMSVAVAAPGKFTAFQTAVQVQIREPPAAAYARALQKYNISVPADVAKAASGEGSAAAVPVSNDVYYLTNITIGGQTLTVDIDTGSSDLWVYSSKTPPSVRGNHSFYTPGNTAQHLKGEHWSIYYGDGSSASGNVWTDVVTVGGISVKNQSVELVRNASQEFKTSEVDGLFGFAFDKLNRITPTPQKTWFTNALPELASPILAAALGHDAPGTYDFGFADPTKYSGNITYANVDSSQGFWNFNSQKWAVGGVQGDWVVNSIADTGTTLILTFSSIVDAYYAQVNGSYYSFTYGGMVFPCNATLPTFSLLIHGYNATVPGEYMNYLPVDKTNKTCYGGLQSNSGMTFSIMGDVFLKSQYVVFNRDGPKIGFAQRT